MASFIEGEWSCYIGGKFNGGRMVLLEAACSMEGIGEVASLTEGEWSCYRGGKFNKGRMTMLERWSV